MKKTHFMKKKIFNEDNLKYVFYMLRVLTVIQFDGARIELLDP